MPRLMLIGNNEKEKSILRHFLQQQKGLQVVDSNANYANFLRALQYRPDAFLVEIPKFYADQLNFIKLIKKNKYLRKAGLLAYGDHRDPAVINGLKAGGVGLYLPRPIKSEQLLGLVQKMLPMASEQGAATSDGGEGQADDVALILDKSADPQAKIDLMVGRVESLLAFPFTVAKVLRITQEASSGARELAEVIGLDPVIAARILKLSNSVLFASKNRAISDVKQAIVRIGFRETKNIVMSMSVMKLITGRKSSLGFDLMDFWYHSLACAVISQELAVSSGYAAPEEAFMAGLLHDFGVLVLHEFFGPVFSQVLDLTTRHGTSFEAAEEEVLGIPDGDIAATLFEKWSLPPGIIFALRHHNTPGEEHAGAEEPLLLLNRCVGLANLLAKVLTLGNGVDQCVFPIPDELLQNVNLSAGFNELFFQKVYQQVNLFAQFLNLDGRKIPCQADGADDNRTVRIAIANRNNHRFDPITTYLRLQCYTLEWVGEEAAGSGSGGSRPDLLIVHARPDDTAMAIINELNAIERSRQDQASPDPPAAIPTIVLHAAHSEVAEAVVQGKVKLLEERVDLRNIEMTIARLLGASDEEKKIDELRIVSRLREDAVRVFGLSGVIRVSTIAELKEHFMACLQQGTKYVALELSQVEFIDSSGLGLIVNFFKRLNAAGGRLCLLSMSETVARLIDDVKLNKVLPIAESEDQLPTVFGLEPTAAAI